MNKTAPIPGKYIQLDDSVLRLTAPNPSFMTGAGTNTYIIGNNDFLVIDPGPNIPKHIDMLLNATEGNISYLVATHTHPDHSEAVKPLAKLTGAKVIGKSPPKDQDHDQTFKPNKEINDGDIINIEDIEIMAIETPGHASNHVCFFSKSHKVLFSGDHLMNGSSVLINPPDGDMQKYISSFKKIDSLEMRYIAPAHGAIFDNPYEIIKHTLLHRLSREARIIKSLKNNPKSNLSNLVKYVYDDVDQSIHFIAVRSLLAHLVKLEKEGIVNNEDDFWDLN